LETTRFQVAFELNDYASQQFLSKVKDRSLSLNTTSGTESTERLRSILKGNETSRQHSHIDKANKTDFASSRKSKSQFASCLLTMLPSSPIGIMQLELLQDAFLKAILMDIVGYSLE
uniref:26S proteasome non-ATPase regulatory subunit 1/RPN2 N-terminal domain-containing protein n=1 Tax=Ditylenchus dipsaci TaxID=166011 RepID=A0A915CUK4_9BILA